MPGTKVHNLIYGGEGDQYVQPPHPGGGPLGQNILNARSNFAGLSRITFTNCLKFPKSNLLGSIVANEFALSLKA